MSAAVFAAFCAGSEDQSPEGCEVEGLVTLDRPQFMRNAACADFEATQ